MADKKISSETASRLTRKAGRSKTEKIQTALYQIADAASAMTDMQEFYAALHRIVGKLMYAKSFYVTLYDTDTGVLSSPYFADATGDVPPPPTKIDKSNKSLRAYVLLKGKALHVSAEEIEEGKRRGKFTPMGTPAEDWIGVPLKMGGQIIGSLTIQSYKKGVRYSEQDVQLLEFVAQHIAVALTRARAIDETRQRNAELAIINSVQAALAAHLDIHGIYEAVGEKLREIFDYQDVGIYSADLKTHVMTIEYGFEKGRKIERLTVPMNSLYEFIVAADKYFVFNGDFPQFAAQFKDYQVIAGELPKSALAVPVPRIRDADLVVYLVMEDVDGKRVFSESDVRLLQTLASSMSVALENARLFDETQQRNSELAIINSVQAALAAQLDIHGIYEAVGEKLQKIFSYQDVTIYTSDPQACVVTVEYSYAMGQKGERRSVPMNSLYEYFVTSNKTFIFNGDLPSFLANFSDYSNPEPPKSLLAVPVRRKKETDPLVYLTLQDWEGKKFFSDSDVRLLETLANSMSVALENARLWEQEKLFRKALQRELDIGREIQQGFLPEALPRVEGWDIAASLMSAREVAGDFYDAFELPDGTLGLVIADVCDKGVGAALFMTLFRSLIRAAANLDYFEQTEKASASLSSTERLQRAISLTNNYIAETHGDSGMFATLFFGILDPRGGRLAYINGGHEPPLIMKSGLVRETLHKTGPAVGAIPSGHFEVVETHLLEGEMFFAFTDGVPDCKDPHGEFFGRERLLDILLRSSVSAHELVDTIGSGLRRYIASANQFDDITLLAVKRLGT